ncbi:MAG: agarase, partial [Draconibacterium sp.]|nr:agarase [Draconibacterium sp.]
MKKLIFFTLAIAIFGCGTNKEKTIAEQEQKYIDVDARVRVYNSDGTRTYKEYEPFKTLTVDLLAGFKPSKKSVKLSKYGGNMNLQSTATGFFHVKKIGGRWWAIDPEGVYYVNIALNSITVGKSGRNKKALEEKFGTKENWMKETIRMLQENGFNCAGSWSDVEAVIEANKTLEKPMAYCI